MSEATKIAALPQSNSSAVVSMDPLVAMIERAARDPAIDLGRLKELMAMKQQELANIAEGDFNDAMAKVQQELEPIARDSNNPQTRSKYASYYAIDKAIRPIYTKHGFRVSFDEEDTSATDMVRVVAFVTRGRHRERYHYDSPIVTTGLQGKAMMTLTHARASADSYAKRYLMGRIFNLSTGEDDDGNAAGGFGETITQEQYEGLLTLIEHVGANLDAFLKLLKVTDLIKLPQRQYDSAVALLKAKSERKVKQNPEQGEKP